MKKDFLKKIVMEEYEKVRNKTNPELNLKKQLKEAVDSEEYETAAKIKKLIDKNKKRDK